MSQKGILDRAARLSPRSAILPRTTSQFASSRMVRAQLGLDGEADESRRLEALFVLSLMLGLRPGELRKLTWDHVDLDKGIIHVWRSASRTGDVKTPQSKRSLVLPRRAVEALEQHKKRGHGTNAETA